MIAAAESYRMVTSLERKGVFQGELTRCPNVVKLFNDPKLNAGPPFLREFIWEYVVGMPQCTAKELAAGAMPRFGAVYVISGENVVTKVGFSTNIHGRRDTLQTGQDRELTLYWAVWLRREHALKVEAIIHRWLKTTAAHARGEWYYLSPATAAKAIHRVIEKAGFPNELDAGVGWYRDIQDKPAATSIPFRR